MYGLTKEQKLKFIIEKSEELGISSYEYGQNTEISDLGARNILTGESKNPRTKNLNIMLRYLENKVVGTELHNKSENSSLLAEPNNKIYLPKITKDRVVPYYNIEISGSNFSSFTEAKEHIEFYIDYKPLNDCTAYLPYFGNSMSPMFSSGNTLAVKQIVNLNIILWGEPHLIITNADANSYKTVKFIHKHNDPDKVILRALNPEYSGDIMINKKDILSLFIVRGKIELNDL